MLVVVAMQSLLFYRKATEKRIKTSIATTQKNFIVNLSWLITSTKSDCLMRVEKK